MNWTITAGAVCSALGVLTAGPAAAEAGTGGPPAADQAGVDQAVGGSPRAHRATSAAGRSADRDAAGAPAQHPGGRGTRIDDGPEIRPWHCHRWPYWPPIVLPVDPADGNRNALFAANDEAAPAIPPLAFVTAMTTSSSPGAGTRLSGATLTAATAPLGAGPAPNPPSGGPMIPAPPPPPVPTPRPPAGPSVGERAPAAPSAPAPARAPITPRAAAVSDAATQALPGLVGLVALTGAGGLLGYRQAKAGFALHAAGTARFLP